MPSGRIPLASSPQVSRKLLLPYDDLGIVSEFPDDLVIPRDVGVALAYLVAKGPTGYKLVQVDSSGNLLTSGSGGAGSGSTTINDPTTTTQKLAIDSHGTAQAKLLLPDGSAIGVGNPLPVSIVSNFGGTPGWAVTTILASGVHVNNEVSSGLLADYKTDFIFYLSVTAVGANSGTLYIQSSIDGGTTWFDAFIVQPQNFNAIGNYMTQLPKGFLNSTNLNPTNIVGGQGLLGPYIRARLTSNGNLTFALSVAMR
jgi:hypothetical protein